MPPPELDLNALFDADTTTGKAQHKQKSPRQRSRKSPSVLLGLLLLAVGFAAGFFSYDLFDRDEPVIEPIATIQPNFGYIPATHYAAYSNDDLTCYVYTEKLEGSRYTPNIYSSTFIFSLLDGTEEFILESWPILPDGDSCNFFLRVEFTEAGKSRFDMDAFRLRANEKDPNDTGIPYLYLGMAGYNEGEGLFIFGYLPETISLELYYAEEGSTGYRLFYHDASPIGNGISAYTRSLVELALAADEQVWTENNGGLPETFQKGTMLADILKQRDCIDCILEYAASTDPVERARSLILLEHPAFQAKMNTIHRLMYQDIKQ